jgi:phage terminase large subunit-like protein
VVAAFGAHAGNFYLIDLLRERVDFETLFRAIRRKFTTHNASVVLVENTGVGTVLLPLLERAGISTIAIPQPRQSKRQRFGGIAPCSRRGGCGSRRTLDTRSLMSRRCVPFRTALMTRSMRRFKL